jgi:DICT domain-containing protein
MATSDREPDGAGQLTKRLLVELSHGIEQAVLAAPPRRSTVVVTLFQRRRYYEQERSSYLRLAAAGAHVVVAFADDVHDVPDALHPVELVPGETLSGEWAVIAVGPRSCAYLVARDLHSGGPEAGRRFDGRWGCSREAAQAELARLRRMLGDRLDRMSRAVVDTLAPAPVDA